MRVGMCCGAGRNGVRYYNIKDRISTSNSIQKKIRCETVCSGRCNKFDFKLRLIDKDSKCG